MVVVLQYIWIFSLLVNVIVVLDQERLYNDLKKQFGSKVQIVHLPKSGGVSDLSNLYRNCLNYDPNNSFKNMVHFTCELK